MDLSLDDLTAGKLYADDKGNVREVLSCTAAPPLARLSSSQISYRLMTKRKASGIVWRRQMTSLAAFGSWACREVQLTDVLATATPAMKKPNKSYSGPIVAIHDSGLYQFVGSPEFLIVHDSSLIEKPPNVSDTGTITYRDAHTATFTSLNHLREADDLYPPSQHDLRKDAHMSAHATLPGTGL